MSDTFGFDASVVPDVVEPIVGVRAWTVRWPGVLTGWHDTVWLPGEALEAKCLRGLLNEMTMSCPSCPSPDGTYHDGYGCGLYAYKSAAEADPTGYACGEVQLWGRVYEHAHGWRAQFARPVALYDTGHELLDALAERYDVPVVAKPEDFGREYMSRRHRPTSAYTFTTTTAPPASYLGTFIAIRKEKRRG